MQSSVQYYKSVAVIDDLCPIGEVLGGEDDTFCGQ